MTLVVRRSWGCCCGWIARSAGWRAASSRLERELARNSRNSSRPPSAEPPGSGPARGRRAGRRTVRAPSRAMAAVGESCCRSRRIVSRAGWGRHQVEELPRLATRVVEHHCQRVRCPGCGRQQAAELPAGVGSSAFGPRLQAVVATLSVRNRISRRDVLECCGQLVRGADVDRVGRGGPLSHSRRAAVPPRRAGRGRPGPPGR